MPAYKDRRSGRWRYRKRVTLPDGRRVRIEGTPATDTKKAAEYAEQMHALRMVNPSMVPTTVVEKTSDDEVPTVSAFAPTFLDNYGPNQKPSARHSKRQIVRAHLLPFFGHMRLDSIRQIDVDSFATGQLASGIAPKTVNNRLGVLSTLLHYGLPDGHALKMHVRAGAAVEIDAVSAADVEKLIAACADPRYRAAILLAADAGLRVGEIRGLQRGDVADGLVTIRRAVDTRNNVGSPKHDRLRRIPTSARLEAALAAVPRRGLWVVSRLDGGMLGYWAMLDIIHEVYDAAEVDSPPMPWHCLRHTFGTELAASGVGLHVVRDLMGHSDIKTTMRYVTVVDAQRRDAIDRAFRRR